MTKFYWVFPMTLLLKKLMSCCHCHCHHYEHDYEYDHDHEELGWILWMWNEIDQKMAQVVVVLGEMLGFHQKMNNDTGMMMAVMKTCPLEETVVFVASLRQKNYVK